jgi:hypothetical protein
MSTAPDDQSAAPVAADDVTLAPPAVAAAATPMPTPAQAAANVARTDGPDLRAAAAAARERAVALRAAAAALPQEKPASISGTLYDPLGGLLPGVGLTLTDQAVGIAYTAVTDRNGSFSFGDLQPATYELRAVLPGFSSVSTVMPIGAGANLERHITMPIGSLQESITVGCSYSPGPAAPRARAVLQPRPGASAPQAAAVAPFHGGIGGQIHAPRQVAKANPICPNHIGVDTVIILSARVGIDGYLSDIKVLRENEKLGPDLANSAIEAVRLWQYTPTLLNGVPVEANITVTVFFTWK